MKLHPRLHLLRLCRYQHNSVVSSKDLALSYQNLDLPSKAQPKSEVHRLYPRFITSFSSINIDGSDAERNSHLVKLMGSMGNPEELIGSRVQPLQQFLGPAFNLEQNDMLLILCGLANLKADDSSKPAGSAFERGFIHQNVLREHGKRYFEFHWNNATIFSGISHLSSSHGALEQTLDYFKNYDHLIIDFMKRHLLYNCLIPYRTTGSYGLLPRKKVEIAKDTIRNETAVGSFFTMLGLLLLRFGKSTVDSNLLHQKILKGRNGLFSIASLKDDQA